MNASIIIRKLYVRWAAASLVLLAVVFSGVRYASAGTIAPIMASVSCDSAGNAQVCLTAASFPGTINVTVNGNPAAPISVGAAGAFCMSGGSYNPGDVLVFASPFVPQTMTTTCPAAAAAASTIGCTGDGRLNSNCGSPVAVYCSEDKIDFYVIDANGEGYLALRLSGDDLSNLTPGTEPKLVKQVGNMRVYLLPDGTLKLLMPQSDGKTYYLFWDDCSPYAEGAGF